MTRHLLLVVYVILGIFMLPVLVQAQSTSGQQCFIGTNNPTAVQARSTWTINQAANTVTIRTTLSRTFVDNTYGTNTVGWPGSHTFSNLTGSDYLQIALLDNTNTKRLEFKMDYMSSSSSAPSGFRSLGVTGGDGNMIFGSTSNVLNVVTSLDANFNQFGYVLTTNSPATNSSYAPNPTYPNWIFDVWYEVTVNLSVFGPSGFGKPNITGVHASPSKTGNNSEPVTTLSSCCALFTPTVSGNNTVCNGSNAQLTVNNAAGSTYLWSTGATTASITVSPSTTTTYTVTVTSSDGCVVTLNRTVSISCVTFDGIQCFIGTNNPTAVQAQSTWTINQAANTVTIRTTLSKTFVDNTYGTNKIGWPGSHTFSNLTGSDYLQIALLDNTNTKRLEFKMDYMSSSSAVPSGFRSLGVTGGDGNMIFGSTSNVLNVVTSLDANFNQFGYVLTTNSPATNSNYDPNPTYPNWIFDVWYEVTVNLSVFGPSGFGKPNITGVHASPSKTGNNSEPVSPTCCNLPANPISGTTTICSGTGTTLTASGGGTYLWSTGATTASITVSPTATTTYNVTVTSTGNCTSSTGVTVTVQSCVDCTNITPGTIAANQTICPGGDSAPFSNVSSATTSFSGGVKYQWYRFVGASAPTNISSATLIPGATASTYDPPAGSVTAKTWFVRGAAVNSAACTTFNSFSNWVCVDVGPIPAVPVCSPTVSNVCPATTVNLLSLVPATPNTPGGTFEWRTGTSPTSALVPNQTSVGAGTYYLFEKSSAGCYSQPLAVTVTINTCVQPSLTINNVTVNENAGIATLQICSSVASTTPITVTYTTSNGTATAGTDYLTISANATIPAGQTCVNVSIPIVDDNIPEPTETFNVTLTNPVGATIAIPVGIVTILDNDVALPSLVINDVTVNENAGVATLQVCASASSTSPIVFTYTTSNGTAIAGTDYTAVSTTANIPAGQTCVNISIPIIDDILPEPTENFTVNLSNPTNATIADPQGVVTILDNDSPLPSLVINDITVNENVGNAVLQICASAVVTSPVTVTYTTQNGTALAGGDYTATTATANIPVGQTCVNISIPIIDDLLPEITENFTVNLSNPQAATIADPLGVVTILDNDTPIPALTINDITVNENAGFATLQICASAASAQPVTVTFTTSNGSAVAGADYTPTTNTATIPAGQTCVNINIPIVDDLTPEPTETFNVNLSNPVNATILDPLGIVTILDNDVPPPSLVINDVTVNENAGTATLQICASATALLPITVTYTTANGSAIAGSDYTATTTTATIPVGQTCVNINIPIIDDNIQEPTETFSVNLSNPNNATIADPQGVVTILDNDIPPPCLTSIQITGIACNNNGTPSNPNDDTYTFVLTVFGAGTGSNWVGSYSNPALGVFQFAPTPYNTPVPLGPFPAGPFTGGPAVPPLFFPNGLDISISVQDATNPSCPSNTVVTSPGPCSNVLPSLTINDVTVNENAGTATLQICASAVSGSPITVNYSTLNANAVAGSDYTFTNATATIPVGQTCVNVSFPIIDDTTPEPTEAFTVNLTNPTNATIADPQGVVTIIDNDVVTPSLTINDVTVNESAGTATLQICASTAGSSPITVTYTTGNGTALAGSDYTATTATATIPAGQTCVNVSIPIINDTTPEPTETFTVNLTNPTNATIADPQGVVTIIDNDTVTPSLTINDVTVNESAGTATLQICASTAGSSPITVTYTTGNGTALAGSDYTATTATATIPAGQTCVNVSIPIINDTTPEPTETFTVNLTNPTNATIADPQGVVTIIDNDTTLPKLSINSVTVNENAGNATLQICADAFSSSPITVTYTTANGTAISGTDYTATTATATIPAGQTCVSINIPIIDDTTPEPTETFTVNLSNPNGATILTGQGTVTILDNDTTGSCDNVTNPGSGGSYQGQCGPYTPATIVEIAAPFGGSGTFEYVWQSSANNWLWTDIPGANSATYSPGQISSSTFYRRGVRRNNCTAYLYSNSVLKEVTGPCSTGCDNVTFAGTVGSDETGASPFDPANITQISAPSGGSGLLQYQWQQSTNGTTWTDISGATAMSYDPSVITQTTLYRRGVRRANCTVWLYSNNVTKTVTTTVNCNDVTGGSVGYSQTICTNGDPVAFVSLAPATTSFSGGVKYLWVRFEGVNPPSSMALATPIPGATGITYDAPTGSVTTKTWFRRCSAPNSSVCTNYPGESEWIFVEVINCGGNTCSNVTNPGEIGYYESKCAPYDPAAIVEITAPVGGNGNLEYIWQSSTDNWSWTTISGATAATYDPPVINQTTFFRRGVRRAGCTDYLFTNSVLKRNSCGNKAGEEGLMLKGLSLMPVPAFNDLTVRFETLIDEEPVTITVFDLTGRVVSQHEFIAYTGMNQIVLNVTDLLPGYYILSVSNGGERQHAKFTVVK